MIWVPIALGLFKVGALAATFVLCIKSQREGEREEREAEEAMKAEARLRHEDDAGENELKSGAY